MARDKGARASRGRAVLQHREQLRSVPQGNTVGRSRLAGGTAWHGSAQLGTARFSTAQLGTAWHSLARPGWTHTRTAAGLQARSIAPEHLAAAQRWPAANTAL